MSKRNIKNYAGGYGTTVIVKSRDDLFEETGEQIVTDSGQVLEGIQIFNENSVTSIPDNVGCCEVVSVGSDVTTVQVGDVVFVDFCDVKQGFIVDTAQAKDGAECYAIRGEAFKCKFDPETGRVEPLPGYVITKPAPDRMKVALTGTDRVEVPAYMLTQGIVSGRDSDGKPCAWTVYQEVVTVGLPEVESKTRALSRQERELLDDLFADYASTNGCISQYDELGPETAALVERYVQWRRAQRVVDCKPGDLVPFCTDFAMKIRVRGEFLNVVPQKNVLAVIDDRAILEDAIRAGHAGTLIKVA